jgi:DNA-binding Lrp family transcriptional regulator
LKDNRRAVKAFANPYNDLLNKGLIPRAEIKRDFYDKGKKLFKENTLDAVWTAFMEGTYNPSTNSLGASKHKNKEKNQIMETTNKRGPKPRKIQFMDSKFEDVLKTFDTVSDVAKHFDMKEPTVRSVLKLMDEDKVGKDYKKRLRYEPKTSTTKAKVEKKIEGTISHEVKIDDIPPKPIIQPGVEESMKEFNDLYPKPEVQAKEEVDTPSIISYKQQLLNKLDDARNAYIEALKNCAVASIAQYGIDLEEKDIHLIAYLDEEFK